jgi:hypothetical protein
MHEEFRNSLKRCYWNDSLLLYADKKQSMSDIQILKRIFLK